MYYRPIIVEQGQHLLAGGWARFDRVEVLVRNGPSQIIAGSDVPHDVMARLIATRPDLHHVNLNRPHVMGILNVTPDSFSDGGDTFDAQAATQRAAQMQRDGAQLIDIGGESTRPGAKEVPVKEEIARILPVIDNVRANLAVVISIDTRKADVVAALPFDNDAPFMINDVSAMRFDPEMAQVVAQTDHPICLMHSLADPETMQAHATYDNVSLDVYDHLSDRIAVAEAAGIARERIVIDPGIGFGKTLDHNLALIRGLSLFHGLGCPILLGASRKRFIGTLGNAPDAKDRLGGSVAVALEGVRQGVQILRVHDTFATKQAIDLFWAMSGANTHDT